VERGDGAPQGDSRQALIQAVEEIGCARTERLGEQAPPGIGRERSGPGAPVAVRPVAEIEARFRMGGSQAAQHLVRIKADAGEVASHAIGGIQGNSGRFAQRIGHKSFVSSDDLGDSAQKSGWLGKLKHAPPYSPYSFTFRYRVVRPMRRRRAALARSPLVAASALAIACFSLSGMEMTGDLGARANCGIPASPSGSATAPDRLRNPQEAR